MNWRNAIFLGIEWRGYAFLITCLVMYLNGMPLLKIGIVAVELQAALFIGHLLWIHTRLRVSGE